MQSAKTKNIAWGRRVNRPRLTRRLTKPVRSAGMIEQRMLSVAATLRVMPEKNLTLDNLHDVFGRLVYYNDLEPTSREIKARPLLRRLIRLNKVDDWTK